MVNYLERNLTKRSKDMSYHPQVIIVGAGIVGLASACHILRSRKGLSLLVVEKMAGPGLGDTAKSAAAFRDMFSSPVNRDLSRGSIAFYEKIEQDAGSIGLKKIGYLWLATARQEEAWQGVLAAMAQAGVKFETMGSRDLAARLPELRALDVSLGIFGMNCGILEPLKLTKFYEQEVLRRGGRLRYRAEVTGFSRNTGGQINGVRVGEEEIPAETVIIAAGAWTGRVMARAGLEVPMVPKKRQLFSVPAKGEALAQLLHNASFSAHNLLPLTILPEGAYLRPERASFLLGYADPDQAPGLEEPARAQRDFFETRIRPQVERYFPAFQGLAPSHAWAGHYDEHPPDDTPFVEWLSGALVVAGSSGSGVMKADSLGRIVAGRLLGLEVVALGHDGDFRVADLGLKERAVPPEEFVI
jgi:glycine/D-amino acid oxidase-like deaminating enzyme